MRYAFVCLFCGHRWLQPDRAEWEWCWICAAQVPLAKSEPEEEYAPADY